MSSLSNQPLPVTRGSKGTDKSKRNQVEDLRVFLTNKNPNDVEIYFVREKKSLWANSTLLKAASPYFQTMLSSDFAEGSSNTSALNHRALPQVAELDYTEGLLPDSDEEDEPAEGSLITTDEKYLHSMTAHTIDVREASYTTYLAVVNWIYTGHIKFATLRSAATDGNAKRDVGTSPKSVYRLAEFLELKSLKKLALKSFESQITVANAAEELFSDISGHYTDISSIVIKFTCDHWMKVWESEGMKMAMHKVDQEKVPNAGTIVLLLMQRFNETESDY